MDLEYEINMDNIQEFSSYGTTNALRRRHKDLTFNVVQEACKKNQIGTQIFLICLLLFSTCFGKYVPIIRRKYRTYATPGISHSM